MKKIEKKRVIKNPARMLSLFLCLLMLLPAVPVQAKKSKNKNYWPKLSEKIEAGSALLMDVDTGTILYKKNINKKYYPASITKILTTLIAVENSSMDEIVTFSEDSIYKTEGSGISRDIGEKMTMEQCLYAVMLESANECAYAVAEHVGGSIQDFVKMMNARAEEIGCTSSHFMNPHGLTDKKHYVTANDMALIAREAYQNETFRLICGTKRYIIPPTNKHKEETPLVNHHKMFFPKDTAAYLYDYCTGGKTGWTSAAGNTLVTYAEKDGMTLLAVILNGSSPLYWNETRSLFEYGFENFDLCSVAEYASDEKSFAEYSTKYDTLNVNEPYAQIDPQSKIILPKTVSFNKTSVEVHYDNLKEHVLAQLKYTYGNREIGTADIIRTNASIDKNGTGSAGSENGTVSQNNTDTVIDKESAQTAQPDDSSGQNQSENKAQTSADTGKNDSDTKAQGKKKFDFSNFSLKGFFADAAEVFNDFRKNISTQTVIILAGILLLVLLLIILRAVFNHSYIIRQKIANFKNKRRAKKQYTIIRDTRKSKNRRRKRRW